MELETRVAILEEQRNHDKEMLSEALNELKAMRADLHDMVIKFDRSKSWIGGLVVGLSVVFAGLFEGIREVWQYFKLG